MVCRWRGKTHRVGPAVPIDAHGREGRTGSALANGALKLARNASRFAADLAGPRSSTPNPLGSAANPLTGDAPPSK